MRAWMWRLGILVLLQTWIELGHAEERPQQILTTLGGSTISGYIDTSASWSRSDAPLPAAYRSYPIVFVTCAQPLYAEGLTNALGQERFLRFNIRRLGDLSRDCPVHLNISSGSGPALQGTVIIPAGQTRVQSRWQISDDGTRSAARAFTLQISLDPVREGWARYRLHPGYPGRATARILDRRARP